MAVFHPRVRESLRRLLPMLLALLPGLPAASLTAQSGPEVARAFREANGHRILAEYAELLSIPNVASDSAGVRRNAEYIVNRLSGVGVDARVL